MLEFVRILGAKLDSIEGASLPEELDALLDVSFRMVDLIVADIERSLHGGRVVALVEPDAPVMPRVLLRGYVRLIERRLEDLGDVRASRRLCDDLVDRAFAIDELFAVVLVFIEKRIAELSLAVRSDM